MKTRYYHIVYSFTKSDGGSGNGSVTGRIDDMKTDLPRSKDVAKWQDDIVRIWDYKSCVITWFSELSEGDE